MEEWGKNIAFNKCFGQLSIHREINIIGCILHMNKSINFRLFVELNKEGKL